MLTIQQADTITLGWIEQNVNLDQARENYARLPFQRESQKLNRPDECQFIGDWAMDKTGEIYALVRVGVNDVRPGEGDWEAASQYQTTRQYVEWFRQGHEPPPIFVVRNANTGDLVSLNRRRWLAAREAGVETLPAFYSPTLPGGRPAWELKPCTWDKEHVCKIYAAGGDCFSCPYYEQMKGAK